MVTGASTADVALILIDARHGVLEQSRRHAYIASLLGIPHLAVCVNKMDLKDFSQEVFDAISADFMEFGKTLRFQGHPVLPGERARRRQRRERQRAYALVRRARTCSSTSRLCRSSADRNFEDFRYPVQYVIRPDLDYRGFAAEKSRPA